MLQDNTLAKFGIDEIYIYKNLSYDLLEKLNQRALFTLDGEDSLVQKLLTHDMLLIFNKSAPTNSLIYRFLTSLDRDIHKNSFIESNLLDSEEELLSIYKQKKFVLLTHRNLPKNMHNPD